MERVLDMAPNTGVLSHRARAATGQHRCTELFVDAGQLSELSPEMQQLDLHRISWTPVDPVDLPSGALLMTAASPTVLHHALDLIRAGGRVIVAIPDLDGTLSAQLIAAGAVAVWNRLADPLNLPKLIRRLAHRGRPGPTLTLDERQLLALLATNATIREIAERMFVSERSFYRRLRTLYAKLGACGRADAVRHYRVADPNRAPW